MDNIAGQKLNKILLLNAFMCFVREAQNISLTFSPQPLSAISSSLLSTRKVCFQSLGWDSSEEIIPGSHCISNLPLHFYCPTSVPMKFAHFLCSISCLLTTQQLLLITAIVKLSVAKITDETLAQSFEFVNPCKA